MVVQCSYAVRCAYWVQEALTNTARDEFDPINKKYITSLNDGYGMHMRS